MVNTGADRDCCFPWWWSIQSVGLFETLTQVLWSDVSRVRAACSGPLIEKSVNCLGPGWAGCCICQWIQATATHTALLRSLPARATKRAHSPAAKAERKRTTSSKTNLLSPYPLSKNKCLPGVSPWKAAVCF